MQMMMDMVINMIKMSPVKWHHPEDDINYETLEVSITLEIKSAVFYHGCKT
jgi:hypothetical protein